MRVFLFVLAAFLLCSCFSRRDSKNSKKDMSVDVSKVEERIVRIDTSKVNNESVEIEVKEFYPPTPIGDSIVKNAVRRVERKVIVFKQEAKAVSDSVFVRSEIRKEDVQEEVKSEHKSKAKSDVFGFKWMFLCLLLLCIVFVFLYLKRSNVLSLFKDVLIRILKLFK